MSQQIQRLTYAARSVFGWLQTGRKVCPNCRSREFCVVKCKRWVTSLARCESCRLLYRLPTDPADHHARFYQEEYQSTLATECPTPEKLSEMLANEFRGTEKKLTRRIGVLRALGVADGMRILDFGASWGYAVWQLRKAGFDAEGYELSRPRAQYAREHLQVNVVDNLDDIRAGIDVFFSAHVLEHLPKPTEAFSLARKLLRPGGLFVAITPNGSASSQVAYPHRYHDSWGRLHPVYLDDEFYRREFAGAPLLLSSAEYGTQYPLEQLQAWDKKSHCILSLTERELLAVVVY